jgi:hypothetical protein
MTGRLNHDQEQLLYSFHLDEAVPHDHPVRKIAAKGRKAHRVPSAQVCGRARDGRGLQ